MPTVSVIITVYNRAQLVSQAIESVLNQTFTDFELIVVNDGSTDNTEEVVYSFTDPRLEYIYQENKGLSAARNTGLKACRGEFVAFLDDDDLFLPEKLALQMEVFENQPETGLVYGKYYVKTQYRTQLKVAGTCDQHLELRQLLLGTAFHVSSMIVRREWLDRVGDFDERLSSISEEWDLTLRLALSGCQMSCVNQPVSIVRIQPRSISWDIYERDPEGRMTLDKTFSDPRLPKELLDYRNLAYAVGLIRNTRGLYAGSHPELGKELLERALALYPPLGNESIDILVEKLLGHVTGFSIKDPEDTLKTITQFLPGDKQVSNRIRRKLWGNFYMDSAFEAHQSRQVLKCWIYMLKAIANQPAILLNRGVISILLRSVLGDTFVERLTGYKKAPKPVVRQVELNSVNHRLR